MFHFGKSAPAPEVASCNLSAVANDLEHEGIEGVATRSRTSCFERIVVAWIAELFKNHWLAKRSHAGIRLFDVVGSVVAGILDLIDYRFLAVILDSLCSGCSILAEPRPVERPYMDARIVDLWEGVDFLKQIHIDLTAILAFASCCHKMVRVDALDELRLFLNPLGKSSFCLCIAGKGTRLIGKLPRHDGRAFRIWLACHGVGARHDEASMVGSKFLRLFVLGKLAVICLESVPVFW